MKTRFITGPHFSFVEERPLPKWWQRWLLRHWFGWKCEPAAINEHKIGGGIGPREQNPQVRLRQGSGATRPAPEVQA